MRHLLVLLAIFALAGAAFAAEKANKANKKSPRTKAKTSQANPAAARKGKIPVILDTDIGDDIDDTWALALLLGTPRVDLKLVVTATDNTPEKTRLVAKILTQLGRTDVPIGTGVKQNDKKHNQEKWLGGFSLEQYKGTVHADGVQALIDTIKASPTTVTLCVLGPQTNIAEALRRDPSIAQKARIVSMFGSVYLGYGGKKTRDAEYNVKRDVKAAQAVFAAAWPITIAPLDSCGLLVISGARYKAIADSQASLAKTVIENYDQWANRSKHPAGASSTLYDTMAAYLCFDEKFCGMKMVKLIVDDKGFTVPDEEKGRPVNCALTFADRAGLEKLYVKTLTRE